MTPSFRKNSCQSFTDVVELPLRYSELSRHHFTPTKENKGRIIKIDNHEVADYFSELRKFVTSSISSAQIKS